MQRAVFSSRNGYKYYILYYIILLVLLLSRQDMVSSPSVIYRFAFLAMLFLPLFKSNLSFAFPMVLVTFFTCGVNGMGFSYMPYSLEFYVIVTLVFSFLKIGRRKVHMKGYGALLGLFFLMTFVDFATTGHLEHTHSAMLIILLFPLFLSNDVMLDSKLMGVSFILISLGLSLQFLFSGNQFMTEIKSQGGTIAQTTGWTDPNYFASIIGMGALVSIINLLKLSYNKRLLILVSVITALTSLVSMFMLASRGAILSLVVAVCVAILFMNTSKWYKFVTLFVIITFVLYCFNNSYFEYLAYRMESSDVTGSGRTIIWANKFEHFINDPNPFRYLIGVGAETGFLYNPGLSQYLGGSGFHNQYVAFLVCYGVLGFVLLIVFLLKPVLTLRKDYIIDVMVYLLYILVCMLTLEPLTLGYLVFWAYIYFVFLKVREYNFLSKKCYV